jgi:transposase InsO family protein
VLEKRLGEQDNLLLLASQLIRDRVSTVQSRARGKRKTRTKEPKTPDDEGPPAQLEHANLLRTRGLSALIAAALVGISASTLRRWRGRLRACRPLVSRRGPEARELRADELARQISDLVRRSRGLFGADSLSHAVPGVSRREALAIKNATLTAMERERRGECQRVIVTEPGVVRGFDAMHLPANDDFPYALCAGDACVAYTTSAVAVRRYDGPTVACTLDADFSQYGAPLVIRLDRASCHRTADVVDVCERHCVLMLHGPPHHPRFYGQLERQNRDRRVWLNSAPRPPPNTIASELEELRVLLNSAWSRRSMHWHTAEERWRQRPRLGLDRTELRSHVDALTARFAADLKPCAYDGLARRLAIEVALTQHGFLRRESREAC